MRSSDRLAWNGRAGWACDGESDSGEWLGFAGNILAGLATILAGAVAWFSANRQIRQQDKQERFRRTKRMTAVKAILPLTLDACVRHVEEIGNLLVPVRSAIAAHARPSVPSFPTLPSTVISTLSEAVEYSSNEIEEQAYSKIISFTPGTPCAAGKFAQRARTWPPCVDCTTQNVDTYILQSAEIYARASALFPYARGESSAPHPSFVPDQVFTGLRLMGFEAEECQELFELAEHRYVRDQR